MFVGFLVLTLGSHHCYYFCPDWVPISDGHSCQDRKVSWLLWGQEICTLSANVSRVISICHSLHLHSLSTVTSCTSEPLVLGVYPEFRLLSLWRCSSQRAAKVPLMLLLPSHCLPLTQLCTCLLCGASSLFLLKCGIWNKILPEDVSAATKPNYTGG